jgi:hypothetical protein
MIIRDQITLLNLLKESSQNTTPQTFCLTVESDTDDLIKRMEKEIQEEKEKRRDCYES